MNRETQQLEKECDLLRATPLPEQWDRASWVRGALYALCWVLNTRGSQIGPFDARMYVPVAGELRKTPRAGDPIAEAFAEIPPPTSEPEKT